MEPLMWSVTSSSVVVADRWIRVRADTCVAPSGDVIAPYYVLEYPDWVNVVAVTNDADIVLVQQYRHAVRRILRELPAGVIEKSDISPETAARRELAEETGFAGGTWTLAGKTYPNPATHVNTTYSYLALGVSLAGTPAPDGVEHLSVDLLDFATFVTSVSNGGSALQALHIASLHFALAALDHEPMLRLPLASTLRDSLNVRVQALADC